MMGCDYPILDHRGDGDRLLQAVLCRHGKESQSTMPAA